MGLTGLMNCGERQVDDVMKAQSVDGHLTGSTARMAAPVPARGSGDFTPHLAAGQDPSACLQNCVTLGPGTRSWRS